MHNAHTPNIHYYLLHTLTYHIHNAVYVSIREETYKKKKNKISK